jgi:hypothetical protein
MGYRIIRHAAAPLFKERKEDGIIRHSAVFPALTQIIAQTFLKTPILPNFDSDEPDH